MITLVNQPLQFQDGYSPRVVGGVPNPFHSLLESDARGNPLVNHPVRRQCFKQMLRSMCESGALDYDDHVKMFEKRGMSYAGANRLANAMEVMSENVYRISEGVVKPWILNNSGIGDIREDTLTTNIASFTRMSMGMVASVFPRSIATELFQVQPLTHPAAFIFYKKYIRKSGDNAGEDISDSDYKTSSYASAQLPEDTEAATTYVKEVGLNITQETVTAKIRKMKWAASLESIMSLQAYHGMSMEALNDDAIRTELALEVDKELIDTVLAAVGFEHTWDPTNGGAYTDYAPSEKKEWNQTLFDAITDAQTSISAARYVDRRKIWIAGNPSAVGRLRKAGENFFIPDTSNNDGSTAKGSLAGTLNSMNKVYEVPWMADDVFLLGYRSDDFADAGFIFAPFIPFFLGPVQWDDSMNFVVKKGGLTWYASKMAVSQMYAKVTISSS